MLVIEVENYGTMKFELDEDNAPITTANMLKLAAEGFYEGLIFHRIISGFMIQGGDPSGTGMGGSDENIKGEFMSNGVNNTHHHSRGTISMARAADPDSASSQFFICHKDCGFLDRDYAAFGDMIEGFEVLDAIADVKTGLNDRPLDPPVIKRIYAE
ncbi:MAG: peptidylprolyl isomerase [Erysipelotrichaceae bacterium]|nr:peptidylprolyl isomerase [Erysipelotrichaceae bacterium]